MQDPFLIDINERQVFPNAYTHSLFSSSEVSFHRVSQIAKKRGVSMAQVALAWSLSKPFISAPIIGTTSLEKMKDLVAGVNLKLTDEEITAIDEPYRPRAVAGMT